MTDAKRRKFLTTLGMGGVAAAAAAAAVQQRTPTTPVATAEEKKQGSGYQLTEHVRKYYRTTKV
jgi:nitrous oxide reductase